MSADALPSEVLDRIFAHAASGHQVVPPPRRPTVRIHYPPPGSRPPIFHPPLYERVLRICSLVCRSWCAPAQRRLHLHLRFTSALHFHAFNRTKHPASYPAASLTLQTRRPPDLPGLEDILKRRRFKGLKTLRLDLGQAVQPDHVLKPHLQELRLGRCQLVDVVPALPVRCPFLRTLQINLGSLANVALLHHLLHRPEPARPLSHLILTGQLASPSTQPLPFHLQFIAVAHHLTHVVIDFGHVTSPRCTSEEDQRALGRACTSVVVGQTRVGWEPFYLATPSPERWTFLATTAERVGQLLATNPLAPSLRRIEVQVPRKGLYPRGPGPVNVGRRWRATLADRREGVNEAEAVCAARGVELVWDTCETPAGQQVAFRRGWNTTWADYERGRREGEAAWTHEATSPEDGQVESGSAALEGEGEGPDWEWERSGPSQGGRDLVDEGDETDYSAGDWSDSQLSSGSSGHARRV